MPWWLGIAAPPWDIPASADVCSSFYRCVWTGNAAGVEKAAGAFVEEDASFEGRTGNPDLESTNTGIGLVNLGSQVRLHMNS